MNIQICLVVLPLLIGPLIQCSGARFQSIGAICIIRGDSGVHGMIHLEQKTPWNINIRGYIQGLTEGKHGFHVHEYGDLSNGCISTGGQFNPLNYGHGAPSDLFWKRRVGDLGSIVAAKNGTGKVQIVDRMVRLDGRLSVVGRAIVVHSKKATAHAGARPVGCCVIGLTVGASGASVVEERLPQASDFAGFGPTGFGR